MAYQDNSSSSLRAASAAAKPASRLSAGPFDAAVARNENNTGLSDALITGMLVVYPVLATVVAAMVGLVFSGPVA